MKNARFAMGAAALAMAGLFAGCTATTGTDSTAALDDTTMSRSTATGSPASATTVDSSAQASYQDRGNPTSPPASAASTSGTSSAQMGHSSMDMKAMCAMHERVMKAKTDAEREAALDANVRAMAPAEKKQYIDMMHKHCM